MAFVTAIGLQQMRPQASTGLMAALLVSFAGIYVGAALRTGNQREVLWELAGAGAMTALAFLGLLASSWWLVVGCLAHGVWDLGHHPRALTTRIVSWWPPFCAVYDWLLAFWLTLRLLA